MSWNFDIDAAPRNGERLWLAHPTDGKVYLTYFVTEKKTNAPRWCLWPAGVEPVAWQPYIVPSHPFDTKWETVVDATLRPGRGKHAGDARAELAGILSAENLPIIEDVGGGV